MRALVTGGSGFIGAHLVRRLLAAGWEVTVFDRNAYPDPDAGTALRQVQANFADSARLSPAVSGMDVVFHLAWSTIHETANRCPQDDLSSNLVPSVGLLEACLEAGVGRVVFVSSGGTVYGPAASLPISEDHPNQPINAYGVAKLAFEKYLYAFRHLRELDYAVLRPSVPFGPGQSPHGRQGAVAVFLHRVATGRPITLWGDGSVRRDFFYVSDLVEALLLAATRKLDRERVFNIGGGVGLSLMELIERIEEVVGRRARLEFAAPRAFDAPDIVLHTGRAARVLGWRPTVGLEEGLSRTLSWIRSNLRTEARPTA